MLGFPKNNEPIKGEFAKEMIESLNNKKRIYYNIVRPFRTSAVGEKSKLFFDFYILPSIRFVKSYENMIRISWLFWGINIFFMKRKH